jgi:hypothetical protein
MLIATYFTPSHTEMANRFVLSRTAAAGFGGVVCVAEELQLCPTGLFESEGFREASAEKLRFLASMPADGRPMLFVDADVALFPGLAAWCEETLADKPGNWIGLQDDIVQWCTGVILFRRTREVLDWFDFVYRTCVFANMNDQAGWHALRLCACNWPVQCEVLRHDVISNYAWITGGEGLWNGQPLTLPDACLLWHANWCVSVERKTRMLEQVTTQETSEVPAVTG